MGAADNETVAQGAAEMATAKPKRQFEVVAMPGVFTRGRWKCWDYREEQLEKRDDILEFEKKTVAGDAIVPNVDMVDATQNLDSSGDGLLKEKESSTIVVTSIAPAPTTPLHGANKDRDTDEYHKQTAPATVDSVHTTTVSSDAQSHLAQSVAGPAVSVPSLAPYLISAQSLPTQGGARSADGTDDDSATSNAPQPNVVAIDNKIEQAMDLVKTHLTFAVREEVEVLRQTITDLEMKVACLESENQLLRQYAPKEVVGNLAAMVQQQRASVPPPSAPQALPPPKVPAGFCSSTFASTLNSVVADVCHEMQQAKTRQQNTPGGEQ